MRITRNGKDPKDKEYEFECNHCGCVFVIAKSEGKVVGDFRDGDYLTYDCPTCKRECTHFL